MTSRQPPSRTPAISCGSKKPIATVAPRTAGAGISLAAQYNNAMMAEEERVATPRSDVSGQNGGFGTFTRVEDDDDDDLPEPPEMTVRLQVCGMQRSYKKLEALECSKRSTIIL